MYASLVLNLALNLLIASSSDSPKRLHFVSQLSVNGCALFVHDTAPQNAAQHLEVEPLMCVKEGLRDLIPRYDPVTKLTYVTVPVTLRDAAVLDETRRQLEHLSPKSIKFATVRDIRVWSDASSLIKTMGFVWNPDDSVGFLRLGCVNGSLQCSLERFETLLFNSSTSRIIVDDSPFRPSQWMRTVKIWKKYVNPPSSAQLAASLSLNNVRISATIEFSNSTSQFDYTMQMQNTSVIDPEVYTTRYTSLQPCRQVRFLRSLRISNCTARVHQRLDVKGHFLIEPLLCHNITSMGNSVTSVMYDISRDMYYLKLDIVLIDHITLDIVASKLSDLAPLNVSFMRVWHTQISLSSMLRNRYEIGRLMVSDDARSGVVQVYCKDVFDCNMLRFAIRENPMNFWIHVGIHLRSILLPDNCLVNSIQTLHPWMQDEISNVEFARLFETNELDSNNTKTVSNTTVIIMQRLRGHVSFARSWTEYEDGFGDEVDFWIGLRNISSLTRSRPVTLRVEMMSWHGDEAFVEFNGFTVGNASTNYFMTYSHMGNRSPQVRYDGGMSYNNNSEFSTMDRESDRSFRPCSRLYNGNGGFWFGYFCVNLHATAAYPTSNDMQDGIMSWRYTDHHTNLREILMRLIIN